MGQYHPGGTMPVVNQVHQNKYVAGSLDSTCQGGFYELVDAGDYRIPKVAGGLKIASQNFKSNVHSMR